MATTKEPFKKLVRLVGRAFYDCSIGSKKRRGRLGDNSRVNVVVLDALTRFVILFKKIYKNVNSHLYACRKISSGIKKKEF